ncbi:DUF7388 family protein [Halosegnis rubeus]|uniref:LLM class flavin-dependent oxidoreductase n=1 Tax=Halosegnis rubeus TaxID=2212850 RepID=A0A5N5ULZ2_9EURY|nr:LLM class flavin-dependent oxidoreductase [Halosegnis rubeus]KAB7518363.1 LLM class flavin-dependent oxidoreductase [Halosegnis rubeus]
MLTDQPLTAARLDGIALKPHEHDLSRAADLDTDLLNVDYEGREVFPDADALARLADGRDLRVTTPVRADGFDPLGDDSLLPLAAGERVLVAGNPAYLTDAERERAVAPRLGAAREQAPEAWVGTEGVERIAMAAGGPQYELLSRGTRRAVRALRAAGFAAEIALYAPVVLTDDEDALLDAVGGYASRRGPVRRALPEDAATDAAATGRAREVLTDAIPDFALVGTPETVGERVTDLKDAGVDTVVGYPARGLDVVLDR